MQTNSWRVATMTDVCVVGSFMMDMIVRTPRFPRPGETVTGSSLTTLPGGKGFNQAVAAARAGASTAMVGLLGADAFGDAFAVALAQEQIDSTAVSRTAAAGTGVGLPLVDDTGQNAIVIVPQANLAVDAAMIEHFASVIDGAQVVVLQLEIPDDAIVAAATIAHEAHAVVVLNPAPFRTLPAELLPLVDLLTPNEHELAQLAATIGASRSSVAETAMEVARRTGAQLVVTLGEAGALVVDSDGTTPVPAYSVHAIDTVGAGDAFTGNLAAGLAKGMPIRESARRANAAAALSVTAVGGAASAPTARQIDAFLGAHEGASC